jgi:hypothetical protein
MPTLHNSLAPLISTAPSGKSYFATFDLIATKLNAIRLVICFDSAKHPAFSSAPNKHIAV